MAPRRTRGGSTERGSVVVDPERSVGGVDAVHVFALPGCSITLQLGPEDPEVAVSRNQVDRHPRQREAEVGVDTVHDQEQLLVHVGDTEDGQPSDRVQVWKEDRWNHDRIDRVVVVVRRHDIVVLIPDRRFRDRGVRAREAEAREHDQGRSEEAIDEGLGHGRPPGKGRAGSPV